MNPDIRKKFSDILIDYKSAKKEYYKKQMELVQFCERRQDPERFKRVANRLMKQQYSKLIDKT